GTDSSKGARATGWSHFISSVPSSSRRAPPMYRASRTALPIAYEWYVGPCPISWSIGVCAGRLIDQVSLFVKASCAEPRRCRRQGHIPTAVSRRETSHRRELDSAGCSSSRDPAGQEGVMNSILTPCDPACRTNVRLAGRCEYPNWQAEGGDSNSAGA